MKDLFGNEIAEKIVLLSKNGKVKRITKAKGYAYPPGTGPAGETCKTCKHSCRVSGGSKAYWKCGLLRSVWTHGPGSDIKVKAPACKKWEKDE